MKKGIIFGMVLLLCVSLLGGIAYAGLDLSGELKCDMDTGAGEGFTALATGTDLGPVRLTCTWKRTWVPSISDSLKLKLGATAGIVSLKYEMELVELNLGTFTATVPVAPLTFEYVRDFDVDTLGTIKVSFAKSL